jgi:ferric-dicitrate binding protein FerR (iron transport regulator)
MVEIIGEVYFEVVPLAAKEGSKKAPFIVRFGTPSGALGEVEVVGTHFNIHAYNDEDVVKTTLLEGKVKVSTFNRLNNQPPNAKNDKPGLTRSSGRAQIINSKLLAPGQQAVATNHRNELNLADNVDTEAVMAWKEGYFSFNQTSLADVMRQLARWYDVEVVYEGPAPNMTFWGGISRSSKLLEVVKILEKSNVHFRIEDQKIIVTK